MACFIEINSDPLIIVNVDRIEAIEKIIDKDGTASYSAMTNSRCFPMDAMGYERMFKNPFVAAVVDRLGDTNE